MKAIFAATLITIGAAQGDPRYVQFVNGMLSAIEPSVGGQTAPCIRDVDGGLNAVEEGLGLIEAGLQAKNVTAVYSGAAELEIALLTIRSAAGECNEGAVVADIEDLIGQIANNPLGVLAKLFPYLRTVSVELSEGVKAFRAGNFSGSGYDVGSVFAILLKDGQALRGANVRSKVRSTLPPYTQFLNGVLSALEPAVAGNISMCVPELDTGVNDVDQAIVLLEAGVLHQNISALFAAAQEARSGLAILRSAAIACNEPQAAADITKLLTMLGSNPLGVIERLFPYAPTIFVDITSGINAWKSQQWYTAGADFGDILARIITV